MERSARYQSFDELPMVDLSADAVDLSLAVDAFAPIRTLRRRDLESIGCLANSQGRLVPTIGGVLLFGRDRQASFPDAWMQVARFAGTDRSRIEDQVDLTGSLPTWIDRAFAFVDRHLNRGVTIDGPRRTEHRPLPVEAVREAIVNSVIHADYSQTGAPLRVALYNDRLEVENPGLLPFGLTIEEMRTGVSRVRNRTMARVFRELRYVEQWGSGVNRMENACRDAGLDAPVFEELGGRFRVTIATECRRDVDLDGVDRTIIEVLGDRGATTAEVAEGIGRSTRTARSRLLKLVERGLVVEVGTGPTDPKRRYHRAAT